MASVTTTTKQMAVLGVRKAQLKYPTGNKNFSVMQSFPAGFSAQESDPFLMCDRFGPTKSKGILGEDEFTVPWHPHRGMDIMTYLTHGVGRHADSMGNRGIYKTPGLQWISVGSGIEHAEGGGTPEGELEAGFQIWINVPSDRKMDDPKYGVSEPETIPSLEFEGVHGKLLSGSFGDKRGPFSTVQDVMVVDFEFSSQARFSMDLQVEHDNCLLYVYEGEGRVNGNDLQTQQVIRLNARDMLNRSIEFSTGKSAMRIMLFSGKMLRQPIAWHGPFVMNRQGNSRSVVRV